MTLEAKNNKNTITSDSKVQNENGKTGRMKFLLVRSIYKYHKKKSNVCE